jgi:molecular chaperone Hsp33
MSHHDQLHRYLFTNHAVRGELVTVNETYQQMLANHDYPTKIQTLLGEMLVATSLLTATLKFSGNITVQLQGDGPLKLAVINGNHNQELRGVARIDGDIPEDASLQELLGNGGIMVITIAPEVGERYQGVVALEGETLAECLENYFRQSEQLPTRIFIRTDVSGEQPYAGGMLLQVLPSDDKDEEPFNHLTQLTATIKNQELFNLPANEVLYRLYHQEEVTLYPPQDVSFRCGCSRERSLGVLATLSPEEIKQMLEEDGQIDMHCDYCGNHYLFNTHDLTELLHHNGPLH